MRLLDGYALITVPDLASAKHFYTNILGFSVGFEAAWFLWLTQPLTNGAAMSLAFMTPDHPSRPPGPEAFDGRGMILTLQTTDAACAFAEAKASNAEIAHPLTVEPWGQKRFMLRDPNGILIDVVEQIEPEQGYWERFAASCILPSDVPT